MESIEESDTCPSSSIPRDARGPYRFTAGNPLPGNDRIIESERLGGRARWAVAATDSGAFSFNHSASSCLSRSMNQRPAGPGGLSVRYTADIAMT
jgi:hypothetical protein